MTTHRDLTLMPTWLGAGTGFVAYVFLGALPGLLYGGYAGLAMSGVLFGELLEPTFLARLVTGGGMVLGLLAALFFFLVAGAFLGTVLGLPFAGVLRRLSEANEPAPDEARQIQS